MKYLSEDRVYRRASNHLYRIETADPLGPLEATHCQGGTREGRKAAGGRLHGQRVSPCKSADDCRTPAISHDVQLSSSLPTPNRRGKNAGEGHAALTIDEPNGRSAGVDGG